MPKFKNKKTGDVIEESLIFYVNKLRNNPDFEELKEKEDSKEKTLTKKHKVEEVENTPQE